MVFGIGYEKSLRKAVERYARERGGRVEHRPRSIAVVGPLGTKETSLEFLMILCKRGEQDNWNSGISTAFKDAIRPDVVARSALITFGKEEGPIMALSDAELRARLRVGIVGCGEWADQLATCAVRLSPGYEARAVLDGFYLRGLPRGARARLGGTDEQLFAFALSQTIPAEPTITAIHDGWLGEVPGQAWLLRPQAVFRGAPSLVTTDQNGLVWTGADATHVEWRLVNLLDRSDHPLKWTMLLWDGQGFEEVGVTVHTVRGPQTPEYSFELSPAWRQRMGFPDGGRIGLWRR